MLIYAFAVFLFGFVAGQRDNFRSGNRYLPSSQYYNLGPKPGNGVGVLQDLSNARILSNEPFIISFEFPKLIGSGDSRKNRFGAKRAKSQRKKNRKPREFRTMPLSEDILQRRNRLLIPGYPLALDRLRVPQLTPKDQKMGVNLLKPDELKPLEIVKNMQHNEEQPPLLAKPEMTTIEESSEEMESKHQNNWENIKKKWISLFAKNKDAGENEIEEENDRDEEKLKAKSRKMWANCQLLKLLKAPQRNPYFYKLLPPNYPALIMNEEKQLECKQYYDVIDLAKDKKMISDKIEQLEKILSSGNETGMRRKREAPADEVKNEEENTLQDESLQGKLEGEVRSDRSKRTKERQHIRTQRSKETQKEKRLRRRKNSMKKKDKEETESAATSRKKDSGTETKKVLEEVNLKPDEEPEEKKREKQEIKSAKDNSLQDVFSPSEVNKVIRQKEMEANIFDRVLRAMKKYEETSQYEESLRPQKRESGNSTYVQVAAPAKEKTDEEMWELEDTIRKLAKLFKILGVKAEANKKKAGESEDDSSEINMRTGKTPKCTCAECPFCQDCFQCFKECRKAALALKNQTPVAAAQMTFGKGGNLEKDLNNGLQPGTLTPQEERSNNVKLERMYRSKLPPTRDQVRVYFDNPENKLLVWTKRGRRTMPWEPLTSDLQLYRDRAKQILKSAEEILQKIRQTEDQLNAGPTGEVNHEAPLDETQKMKTVDDFIKKVVNEDDTRKVLTTPWQGPQLEKEILKGSDKSVEPTEETIYNIFQEAAGRTTEIPKESLTTDDEKVKQSGESSYEVGRVEAAEPDVDTKNGAESAGREIKEENAETEMDNKSIEAAVLPVEMKNEDVAQAKEIPDQEVEKEEEDVPAKVEAVKGNGIPAGDDENLESQGIHFKRKNIIGMVRDKFDSSQSEKSEENGNKVNSGELEEEEWENVEKSQGGKSSTEQDCSEEQEEAERKESGEKEKSRSEESEEIQNTPGTSGWVRVFNKSFSSQFEEKESDEESKENEKSRNGESEEVEKALSEENISEGKESQEVEKSFSEELAEKHRSQSRESEAEKEYVAESKEKEKSESGESEDVEKSSSNESEESVRSFEEDEKSAEEKDKENVEDERVEKIREEYSEELEKTMSDESDESYEDYSDETESVEKIREQESEDNERRFLMKGKLRKVAKQGEIKTFPGSKRWKQNRNMEKKAEDMIKELKKAVELEKMEKINTDKSEETDSLKEADEEEEIEKDDMDGKQSESEVDDEEIEDEETAKSIEKSEERDNIEDHIKSIEKNYIIKGVKQTEEEKEAILKALLNVENKDGDVENVLQELEGTDEKEETEKPNDEDSLKTVVQHLERGHMDEKDFDVIKKMDKSQVDLIVGEMQKNDERGSSVNCETRMKLCQAVCNCGRNGTNTDLDKYEIIKGFLGWLKEINTNSMVPISI